MVASRVMTRMGLCPGDVWESRQTAQTRMIRGFIDETCGIPLVAERMGFEPMNPVKGYTLSRRASSTTPAPLRNAQQYSENVENVQSANRSRAAMISTGNSVYSSHAR